MKLLICRTIIIYLCVLFAMRLMGKRQLGELQPEELVSTILISNLASISIESEEVPITSSLIPLFLIAALELLGSVLSFRSQKFFNFLSGRPKTVILDGQIDQKALRMLRLTTADLMEALRGKNIFDPREVSYAVIETNGTLSAALRPEKEPARLADLPAAVDVGNEYHVGSCIHSHRHVHEVSLAQVYFRYAACALHDNRIVAAVESVECGVHLVAQHVAPLGVEVAVGVAVAYWPSVEHHLTRLVCLRFQQQRVHVRMRTESCRLGLHGLRPSYLQSVGRGIRVERHVLRLKWCRTVSVLFEYAAETGRHHALADVAACSCEHYGVKFLHFYFP